MKFKINIIKNLTLEKQTYILDLINIILTINLNLNL